MSWSPPPLQTRSMLTMTEPSGYPFGIPQGSPSMQDRSGALTGTIATSHHFRVPRKVTLASHDTLVVSEALNVWLGLNQTIEYPDVSPIAVIRWSLQVYRDSSGFPRWMTRCVSGVPQFRSWSPVHSSVRPRTSSR